MKKYLILISMLAVFACNQSKKAEEQAARENEIRQRTIDSIAAVKASRAHAHSSADHHASSSDGSANDNDNTTVEPAKRKGMSNTTKGALIGTGVGIVGGAATGAATSKDKAKGAVIGGAVGGAVGSGVGYGIGADMDRKEREKQDSINKSKK